MDDRINKLVRRAQQGDRTAFDLLFHEYHSRVEAYCTRLLSNRAEGEQACQDTFFNAWTHIQTFRHESPFIVWLQQIALRVCHNLRRTKKGQGEARDKSLDVPAVLWSVEARSHAAGGEDAVLDRAQDQWILEMVYRFAASARPPWDRLDWLIFFSRYQNGMTNKAEIARHLGAKAGTVKFRIERRITPVLKAVWQKLQEGEIR